MNILSTAVPQWVSIAFLGMLPFAIFMIANAAKQGAIKANLDSEKVTWVFRSVFIFYGIYFIYVFVMSQTGIFLENTVPPKVIFFTILPLFLFFMLVVSNLKIYKTIVQNASLESLVWLHIFRFIGIFFIIVYFYGAIPKNFAYVGGFGDIAIAFTSIFVAKAISLKKHYAKILTFVWNIFGILDILSVLTTAIITTKLSIETGSQSVIEMAKFPFVLIPAFAGATIIFLHITIFRKLWLERKIN